MRWFVHTNGETTGPFDKGEIRITFCEKLPVLLCPEGGRTWHNSKDLSELNQLLCLSNGEEILCGKDSVASMMKAGILNADSKILHEGAWIAPADYLAAAPLRVLPAEPTATRGRNFKIAIGAIVALVLAYLLYPAPSGESSPAMSAAPTTPTTVTASPAEDSIPIKVTKKAFILPEDLSELNDWTPTFTGISREMMRVVLDGPKNPFASIDDSAEIIIPSGVKFIPAQPGLPVFYATMPARIPTWDALRKSPKRESSVYVVMDVPSVWNKNVSGHEYRIAPRETGTKLDRFLDYAARNGLSYRAAQVGVWALTANVTDSELDDIRPGRGSSTIYTMNGLPVTASYTRPMTLILEEDFCAARRAFTALGFQPQTFATFKGYDMRFNNELAMVKSWLNEKSDSRPFMLFVNGMYGRDPRVRDFLVTHAGSTRANVRTGASAALAVYDGREKPAAMSI